MENIFIKCECHTHGLDIEVYKESENPNQSEFIFSLWEYGKKHKPSLMQRLKYLWTGDNSLIGTDVVLDLKKAKEMSKFLSSNIDKVDSEIKKHNSSKEVIKDLKKKSEKNIDEILKKPKKNDKVKMGGMSLS